MNDEASGGARGLLFQHGVFRAMACENELRIYAADAHTGRRAIEAAVAEVRRIETTYSRYREDSVVTRINRASGGAPIAVDAETALLLNHGAACHALSQGLFDLTSGVLRRVWDFKSGIPPRPEALAGVMPLIGWDKVEWDGSGIRLKKLGMEIDFGGIGKEYAVDRAAATLHALGIEHGIVNLGGDLRVLGPHPDGSPWQIHILNPRETTRFVATIGLLQGSLATSGDYQRFFDYQGRRYCHILNPLTGQPAGHWQSATTISNLCLDAGSISTIAMLLEDRAIDFLTARGERYLLVDGAGAIHRSDQPPTAQAPKPGGGRDSA